MAQKMIDEKSRVSEGPPPPPEDESAVPFPMNPRYEPQEEPESDGESLGSQDSEEYLSTISEEEEEEEEANKENMSLPPPLPRKRRSASYLGTTLTRPAIKKSKPNEGVNFPTPRKRKPRASIDNGEETSGERAVQRQRRRRTVKKDASVSVTSTVVPEPVSQSVADLKADILSILIEIENYAREEPARRVSIRNRTRESITRQLHYIKNEEKLTKLKTDAEKILHLWRTLS
ncbi:33K [turkey adenovirus 4]|uniref:33K n=1 Tax=turkey adenovirus 4 TaxID=1408257 RepID=U5NDY0_9ADEN|nr:33K [Turkey aviadenovirus 4]AGX93314.1 33K [Turkey aviadenovirus 4]